MPRRPGLEPPPRGRPATRRRATTCGVISPGSPVYEPTSSGGRGAHIPVIVNGEGAYIWDAEGRRYLDGPAGLFTVQVGHGREELAQAAAQQARELVSFPLWSYAHPLAIDLAERLASYAPADLNRVFFTTGGRERSSRPEGRYATC